MLIEVLDEFLNGGGQDEAIREMLHVEQLTDYLPGEEANLFIAQEDGSEFVITLAVSKAGDVVIGSKAIEGATYNVYLGQGVVNWLSKSTDAKSLVKAGLKDKSIVVKASGFKAKAKLGFVKVILFFS